MGRFGWRVVDWFIEGSDLVWSEEAWGCVCVCVFVLVGDVSLV